MNTIQIQRSTHAATLTEHGDGTTELYVTDYVANDWTETYDSLAEALVRVAVLDVAVIADQTFTEDAAEFAALARDFITARAS